MRGEELVFLAWNDLTGLTRGCGVPVSELDERMDRGVGWPMANQALTPFPAFADNPWGPAGEVRMKPDPATQLRINLWPDQPPFNVILCDAFLADGTPWDACPRGFLRMALDDLEREVGLRLLAAFSLDFDVADTSRAGPPFTLAAFRAAPDFGALTVRALRDAGVEPETFGPAAGVGQYRVTCRPAFGIAAADRCVAVREVVREVARRMGRRISFAPAPEPERLGPGRPWPEQSGFEHPGNGAPIHFSLQRDALPAGFDAAREGGLSEVAARFAAGVVRHMPALCAFTAPAVASYFGPGPGCGSAGYACCGLDNRKAGLRICAGSARIPLQTARQFHLEYRPADSAANPYLALGALVRAGLQGFREALPPPPLVEGDPDELLEEERERLGIRRLPHTLAGALDALEADATVRSWFPASLLDTYIAVKRKEVVLMEGLSPQEVCGRYREVY